jgi:kallikrein
VPVTSGPTPNTPVPTPSPTPTPSPDSGGGGGGSIGLAALFVLGVLWLGRTRQRRLLHFFRCN